MDLHPTGARAGALQLDAVIALAERMRADAAAARSAAAAIRLENRAIVSRCRTRLRTGGA